MKEMMTKSYIVNLISLAFLVVSFFLFKTGNSTFAVISLLVGILLVVVSKLPVMKKSKKDSEETNDDLSDHNFEPTKENNKDWSSAYEQREKEEKERQEKVFQEVLDRLGYKAEDLEQIKSDGYERNLKGSVYQKDSNAPYGSIDNPIEIGMEGCCTTLVFIASRGGFCLTDGLGNGWIR